MFHRRPFVASRFDRSRRLVGAMLLPLVAAACTSGEPRRAARAADAGRDAAAPLQIVVVDDAGHQLRLAHPARRVISLVPSATELLLAMGAAPSIVARTMYDGEPELARVPSVGGTLNPNAEAMVALAPDLVITWAGTRGDPARDQSGDAGAAIYSMRTRDTADVFRNIARLGRLTGRNAAAAALAARIRGELDSARASVAGRPTPSVLFVLWGDPPMTAGPNTFIAQLIGVAGGRTLFPDVSRDWPRISVEEIVRRAPDFLVVPIGEDRARNVARLRTAPGWRDLRAVKEGRVIEIPADLTNRPGPHIGETARLLRDGLHPELRHSPRAEAP